MRCEFRRIAGPPRPVTNPRAIRAAWTADERKKARSVLRQLAAERPDQLPRFASESSGAVFAKLIHEEFDRRGEFEGELGSTPFGQLERLDSDELAQLIQRDSLGYIYSEQSTIGLLFDRELVELTAQQIAKNFALRADLQVKLGDVEDSAGLAAREQDFQARYRELLQSIDRILVQHLSNLATFAVADQFTSTARSEAMSHLAEQVPRISPSLSAESRAVLDEIVRQASGASGADPRLVELSSQL